MMSRIGCLLMGFGFLVAWPMPVAGVLFMVLGGILTAIASERTMLPDLLGPSGGTPERGIAVSTAPDEPAAVLGEIAARPS
jgi:hypothetical protein